MIAILLATYNGEEYIAQQLDSLVAQSGDHAGRRKGSGNARNWKCVIHDDGSTDKTVDIVKLYVDKYPDLFCLIDGKSTGGAKNNFLYLLKRVEADYYMFCDQDDYWLPDKVETSWRVIKQMERANKGLPLLVFSDMKVVDKELQTISDSYIRYVNMDTKHLDFNHLICRNPVAGCTAIINRKLRDLSLQYKDINHIVMHDWWVALVASAEGKLFFIDRPLSLYRQHGDNSIGASPARGVQPVVKRVKRLFSGIQIRLTKERIYRMVLQARELDGYYLQEPARSIVEGLKKFDYMTKLQRIQFFVQHHIVKSSRNLWQLLCL